MNFEVRCLHCDVTFPVETRVCTHCGAATAASSDGGVATGAPPLDFDYRDEAARFGGVEETSNWQSSSAAEPRLGDGSSPSPFPSPNAFDQVGETSPTPSAGRSILGSMGSLIWIVVIIALSISNQICSE